MVFISSKNNIAADKFVTLGVARYLYYDQEF